MKISECKANDIVKITNQKRGFYFLIVKDGGEEIPFLAKGCNAVNLSIHAMSKLDLETEVETLK